MVLLEGAVMFLLLWLKRRDSALSTIRCPLELCRPHHKHREQTFKKPPRSGSQVYQLQAKGFATSGKPNVLRIKPPSRRKHKPAGMVTPDAVSREAQPHFPSGRSRGSGAGPGWTAGSCCHLTAGARQGPARLGGAAAGTFCKSN